MKVFNFLMGLTVALAFYSCDGSPSQRPKKPDNPSGNTPDAITSRNGYAKGGGLLIFSEGFSTFDPGYMDYMAPDAEAPLKKNIYKEINGSDLPCEPVDIKFYKDKFYLLVNDKTYSGEGEHLNRYDGMLTILNAETLVKEQTFRRNDIRIKREFVSTNLKDPFPPQRAPEVCHVVSPDTVVIYATAPVFFDIAAKDKDYNATLIKNTYDLNNKTNQDHDLANKVTAPILAGRNLFMVETGFYGAHIGLVKINLDSLAIRKKQNPETITQQDNKTLPSDFITKIFTFDNRKIGIITTVLSPTPGEANITVIDANNFALLESGKIGLPMLRDYYGHIGVFQDERYLYHARNANSAAVGSTCVISRIDPQKQYAVTKNYIRPALAAAGVESASTKKYRELSQRCQITAYPVIDTVKHLMYVPVVFTNTDTKQSENYILVYDIAGEAPTLKNKIEYPKRISLLSLVPYK